MNKKLKFVINLSIFFFSSITLKNLYNKHFDNKSVNLNEIIKPSLENSLTITNEYESNKDNPFELIDNFDIDKYLIKTLTISLYSPPLCNRLYPKSNLYGHELIRYFDF